MALSRAIGDPNLRLAFSTATDVDTPAVDVGAGILRVARHDRLVAELHYRPDLLPAAEHLAAAARSAGLALEYAAAQHALRTEDDQLRESRQRTVEMGDSVRRRLERDLHDGAQQRLIALALLAESARRTAATPAEAAAADLVAHQTVAALDELRTIAHGIFLAALRDDGLLAALTELQDHSPVPLKIEAPSVRREMPAAVAMAAYRIVSDTVHSVSAGASGATVHVSVSEVDLELRLRLAIRATTPHISTTDAAVMLQHAEDRVNALDGTLHIGTVDDQLLVEAAMPCAS